MIEWLHEGGKVSSSYPPSPSFSSSSSFVPPSLNLTQVGIYDAANLSRARRQLIITRCQQENVQLVFIESVCLDQTIVDLNIRNTISSPECVSNLIRVFEFSTDYDKVTFLHRQR